MKIKANYVLRSLNDQYVVVPVGQEAIDFNGIITLNKTGAFLFESLQEDVTEAKLLEQLLNRYDVSKEKGKKDVTRFLNTLKKHNLLDQ